jgi:hypothetical protein
MIDAKWSEAMAAHAAAKINEPTAVRGIAPKRPRRYCRAGVVNPAGVEPLESRVFLSATFYPQQTYAAATGPSSVAMADVNGDVKPGLLLANTDTNTVSAPPDATASAASIIPNDSLLQPTISGRLPTTALVAGGKVRPITQIVKITNTGPTTIDGAVQVDLLLSSSTDAASADPVVGTVTRKGVHLRAGRSIVVPVVVRSLPTGVAGAFHLVAVVTDPGSLTGVKASDGTVTVQAPFIDLSLTLGPLPKVVKAGRGGAVAITEANNSNIATTGWVPVEFLLSTNGLDDANAIDLGPLQMRATLQPGRKITLPFPLSFLTSGVSPGSYFLILKLDPDNTLNDVNLLNNTVVSSSAMQVV